MARVGLWRRQRCCPLPHTPACSTCSPRVTPWLWGMSLGTLPGDTKPSPGGTWSSPTPSAEPQLELHPSWKQMLAHPHCQLCPKGFCSISWVSSSCSSFLCHIHGCSWGELWPWALGFAFKPHPLPSAELLGVKNGLLLPGQELLVRGRFLTNSKHMGLH